MARKQRIHYSGAINHVIVRGNNREAVLRAEKDKAKYLFFLAKDQLLEVTTYSFEDILIFIEKASGVDSERIIHEKYNRQVAAARDMAIYIVIRLGIMTKTELSKRLSVSLVTIIKSYNKVAGDELLKHQVEQILIV